MFYRILHLSDFHWSQARSKDQAIIVRALQDDLQEIIKERRIDKIVFSGDLVHAGSNRSDFDSAKQAFLDPICSIAGHDFRDILICPGNHDVDRDLVKEDMYTESGLVRELISRDKLNAHIDKFIGASLGGDRALERMRNFRNFIEPTLNQYVEYNGYFGCHVDTEASIGFAVFNSAWRSSGDGEVEKGRILLGERVVDSAASVLSKCRIKIAIMHHPLDWLPDWDRQSVNVPIFGEFDVVLFGHVHESWPSSQKNPIGECILAQSGCIFQRRDYYNGYQVIDIGLSTAEMIFHIRRYYDKPKRIFGADEAIAPRGRKEFLFEENGQKKNA